MNWIEIVSLVLGSNLLTVVGSIFYFRPRLAQARADASKAVTEAESNKYEYFEKRIESMEKLYFEQGRQLDETRRKILEMGQELQKKDGRISTLEKENKELSAKVDSMEKEMARNRNNNTRN